MFRKDSMKAEKNDLGEEKLCVESHALLLSRTLPLEACEALGPYR